MNRGNSVKLLVLLILIAAAVYFSINPIKKNTNLGLDLQGGVHVVLKAVPEAGKKVTDDDMVKLIAVMRKRVDELGVSEPRIQREGSDRLIIELAGVDNPEKAIDIMGRIARLEFKDPAGQVILTGGDLKDAKARIDSNSGSGEITLEFTSDGAKKFGSATARLVGQPISIVLDGNVIQSPTVNEPILDGQARITGGFTFEQASENAALFRAGALPVNIRIMEKRTVGPTLGKDSLDKSFMAIIYGITAVFIFMIGYYRLPGILANISLIVYGLILLWILTLLNATLTLPAIAGFLLSIGMAVDANVIIYERLKEELRSGKTLRAAIDAGFKRAFWTIFDANVTTLIAAAVLYYFGTGPIRGFAVTLSVGILSSLFTALVLTRYIIKWAADISFLKDRKLYGA
jgi:preprotein translocase subunit SecD